MKIYRLFPCALFLLITSAAALAQDATTAESAGGAPGADAATAGGQSFFDVIKSSGAPGIVIWTAILAASVTMVTFVIQNFLTLRRESLAPRALVDSLENDITAGNYQAAWETCNANNNYLANVLKAGLERLGRGKEAVEDGIAEHSLREAMVLRTRNSYLSVIGVVSPMIGLLGTVIGMMRAFAVLGSSGIADPRGLATSIGEVLTATASGLFIAIPAFIFYYIFRNRAQMAIVYADDEINRLITDVPYEELAGVRIGRQFSAGAGAPITGRLDAYRVSMELSTNCPSCNGAVEPGENPCPHCGATLEWTR